MATSGGIALPKREGHHRLLASFFPCNANRVEAKISQLGGGGGQWGHGDAVPSPFQRL